MKVARVGFIAAAVLAWRRWRSRRNRTSPAPGRSTRQRAARAGGGGGGGGRRRRPRQWAATVKQTADALTVERMIGDNKVTLTYKLDG